MLIMLVNLALGWIAVAVAVAWGFGRVVRNAEAVELGRIRRAPQAR